MSQHFAIRQLLSAIRKKKPSVDHRKPITETLLHKMISKLPSVTSNTYEQALFASMFLTAFHFALRVGEITDSQHNLQRSQVSASTSEVCISFKSFKHSPQHPGSHSIQSSMSIFCPVKYLLHYISLRGPKPGPLYCLHGKPVTRNLFATTLRLLLQEVGEEQSDFNTHSFRIGIATAWYNKGISDLQIKRMGRWRSNAVLNYIRGTVSHSLP